MAPVRRFSVLLLIFFWGCAGTEPVHSRPSPAAVPALTESPYRSIPPGKDLRSLPEFLVVDDFNNPELKNHFGAAWELKTDAPEGIKTEFIPQDAVQETRGNSLTFHLSLAPGKKVLFQSSLRGLDASHASAVVMKCQTSGANELSSGKFELILEDVDGHKDTADLTRPCLAPAASDSWQDAVIPRPIPAGADWNKLEKITLALSAGESPLKGPLAIDELAFYGSGDAEFLSKRDNLLGFPSQVYATERRNQLLNEPESDKFLYEIARDTWKYFENAVDQTTQLPVDHIRTAEPGDVGAYTTPTNLAMYFLACVAAHELGFIPKSEAARRIKKTFQTLRTMKRWKGFHYNFYNTATLQVTRDYVSTVDAGWLAAAWIVIRQAFPGELAKEATQFLKEINFSEFYNEGIGQVSLGFDGAKNDLSPYHYGLIATEARVMSFIGIGKGDLPREHWYFIYRTPPAQWTWQNQVPQGKETEIERVTFFQGYYTYQGRKFVPSWGGSLFEFLMPALVLKERELAPKSFGYNDRVATEIQIDYALNRQGYPVWGFSPAATSSGRQTRYVEYGVRYLGVKGYRDEGVVSPHASILALDTLPDQVIDNLRRMLELYDIYGEYGFYDSVNVRNGKVNPEYLALDQGMILAAIANYLKKGVLQEYFHRDEIARKAESLLSQEEWVT